VVEVNVADVDPDQAQAAVADGLHHLADLAELPFAEGDQEPSVRVGLARIPGVFVDGSGVLDELDRIGLGEVEFFRSDRNVDAVLQLQKSFGSHDIFDHYQIRTGVGLGTAEELGRHAFVGGENEQAFRAAVEPADGMGARGEIEIHVAEQADLVAADELRHHVGWLVDEEVTMLAGLSHAMATGQLGEVGGRAADMGASLFMITAK